MYLLPNASISSCWMFGCCREYEVKELSRRSAERDVELPGSKTRILVKPDARTMVP